MNGMALARRAAVRSLGGLNGAYEAGGRAKSLMVKLWQMVHAKTIANRTANWTKKAVHIL
jgi:hypothetical protein